MTDYAVFQSFAVDEAGNVRARAYVEVTNETTGLPATIYSGRTGGALANPFQADSDGYFRFHTVGAFLKIRIYEGPSLSPTFERIFRYVPVGLAQGYDVNTLMTAIPDGTEAAPGLAFAADTNTGLYRIGADNIGIAVGGNKIVDVAATLVSIVAAAALSVLSTTASSSSTTGALKVAGGAGIAGAVYAGGNVTAPAFIPNSATVPTAGVYLSAANRIGISASSTGVLFVDTVGVGIGGVNTDSLFTFSKTFPTGAGSTVYGMRFLSTIPSVATNAAVMFQSIPSTEATAFAVADVQHFVANLNTIGAGSSITITQGFVASSGLGTKATTAYGFRGTIASGSGKWNAYLDGTARNYMGGALSIGATTDPGTGGLYVNGDVNLASTTVSTSTTTGALKVGGGLGVAGALFGTTIGTTGAISPGNLANFYISTSASNGVINWDSNDYLSYIQSSNTLQTVIGSSVILAITSSGSALTGTETITSASASALAVGLAGATNPAFKVDSSVGSQAAGLSVTGAVTGGTVAISAIDSGSNTNLTINGKGSGTIGIGSVSTGLVTVTPKASFADATDASAVGTAAVVLTGGIGVAKAALIGTTLGVAGVATLASGTATPAGGSTAARLLLGTTAGFGIYYGSGAPSVSAAAGSVYIRTDNAGANLRLYSNTTGSTTWAAITSA